MKTQDLIILVLSSITIITILFIVFLFGYDTGHRDIRELEDAGYKIVKHEVRHGEFMTNWIEVIKKGEAK